MLCSEKGKKMLIIQIKTIYQSPYGGDITLKINSPRREGDYNLTIDFGGGVKVGGSYVATETWVSNNYSKLLTVESNSNTVSVPANGTNNGTFSVAKTGYTPIGIVGWQFPDTNSSHLFLPRLYLSGNTCHWLARNTTSSAYSGDLTVYVLYIKS
jgi:hypothetical protein